MSAFQRIVRTAALAAVAISAIAAAGSASANVVSISRWECPSGFWELNTYESTDGGPEVLVKSDKTTSACPRAEAGTPELNARYQIQPYQLHQTLNYSFERPQPQPTTQIHISPRYAF